MSLSPRFAAIALLANFHLAHAANPAPSPQKFSQEVALHRTLTNGLPPGVIQWVAIGEDRSPRIAAAGGWLRWDADRWVATANDAPTPTADVVQSLRVGRTNFVLTARELFVIANGAAKPLGAPSGAQLRQVAIAPDGAPHLASSAGLHRLGEKGWEPLRVADGLGRLWAAEDVRAAVFDSHGRLWFATKAGAGRRDADGWKFYEGKDGLPWNDFTCAAAGPEGDVWFGTRQGAIRWDGHDFHYRQGPRWLPNDDVRGIAVDPLGNAWFATAQGVGLIQRSPMTLAQKAEVFEAEIERYIKRTPYGYVAEAHLKTPADKGTATQHDSDNDGLWTAMYGAGECYAYGATRDPKAKARAAKAFEALRFLQKVTQGGSPAPPHGYVARTIRPINWPDPNIGRIARDIAEQKEDALWKVYEPRWPKSADGQWFWKSDTSSDELDGHYFFYPLYYDLVAESAEEKERVREVVRDLTDHLIQHDFNLVDHDGKPTRWGYYSPKSLNNDPGWWAERGLKSLSMLAYLSVAEHLTGDKKYAAAARELLDRHSYAQNLMFPKVQFGPGSGNHSDDEMAVMCFYTLLRCSKDEALKNMVRYSFYAYAVNEAPEMNPFFNYAYASQGLGQKITNIWGAYPVEPWAGWQADSIATLRGIPLDRLDWPHKNSHRLDVVPLSAQKSKDLYEPARNPRGRRANGKVVPVENRHFNHWNTDPWDLDYGGNGSQLGAGTIFLLPYYMGLYHNFIEKP